MTPHFVVVNDPPSNEIRMFSKQLLKNLAILKFILSKELRTKLKIFLLTFANEKTLCMSSNVFTIQRMHSNVLIS